MRAAGKKLEIAIAIGNHPAILLGSQMYVGLSEDECDIAGGLLGDAQGIRCDTDASGLKDRRETRNDQRCQAEVMAGVQVP